MTTAISERVCEHDVKRRQAIVGLLIATLVVVFTALVVAVWRHVDVRNKIEDVDESENSLIALIQAADTLASASNTNAILMTTFFAVSFVLVFIALLLYVA